MKSGKYAVAVSGGVDSVVLLDMLVKNRLPDLQLSKTEINVAHFDHGIRPESADDRKFVENLAKNYGLDFFYQRVELGPEASEEQARDARYKFLNQIKNDISAVAIVTAHHNDDVLETAIFNILRGTNRRGLSSLKSSEVIRPLLHLNKDQILSYAKEQGLNWVEDPTNKDLKYSRNKIRQSLQSLTTNQKEELLSHIKDAGATNQLIDDAVGDIFDQHYDAQKKSYDRQFFSSLPHKIATEILVHWMIKIGAKYDKKLVNKLVNDIKTLKPGSKVDIDKKYYFELSSEQIRLKARTEL